MTKDKEDKMEGEVLKRLSELETLVRDMATELEKSRTQTEVVVKMADAMTTLVTARGTGEIEPLRVRGTGDDLEVKARSAQIRLEVEDALRERIMTLADLVATTREKSASVHEVLKKLKMEKKVVNVGTPESPRWSLVIGDSGPTVELHELLLRVLRQREEGWTLQELVHATGARQNRVSGALVELRRAGWPIENRGTPRRATWYLAPGAKRELPLDNVEKEITLSKGAGGRSVS